MRGFLTLRHLLVLPLLFAAVSAANAGQIRSTTGRGISAVTSANGFSLRPVGTSRQYANDLAPTQLFEIVRPSNQRITLGRLFTSCTCVVLEADKTTFEPGEPAIVRLRNIQGTPPAGQMYAIYVQLNSPIRTVLRHDTFVQSSQFVPASTGEAPTRGNIQADGVYTADVAAGDDIEVIVPKADNYIADTSEYTLRKQAQEEAADTGSLSDSAEDDDQSAEVSESDRAEDAEVIEEELSGETETPEANATEEEEQQPKEILEEVLEEGADVEDEIIEVVESDADDVQVIDEEVPAVDEIDESVVVEAEAEEQPVTAEEEMGAVAADEPAAVVEEPTRRLRVSPRVAARKQAMKNSMRAAEEMTDKSAGAEKSLHDETMENQEKSSSELEDPETGISINTNIVPESSADAVKLAQLLEDLRQALEQMQFNDSLNQNSGIAITTYLFADSPADPVKVAKAAEDLRQVMDQMHIRYGSLMPKPRMNLDWHPSFEGDKRSMEGIRDAIFENKSENVFLSC